PHWRTRMLPAVTNCPIVALMPRRCERESRPLRVEPCPFLCAMRKLQLCYTSNFRNFNARIFLAMPYGAAVVFTFFIFKSDHFGSFHFADQLCMNRPLFYMRKPYLRLVSIVDKKNFIKFDFTFRFQKLDI